MAKKPGNWNEMSGDDRRNWERAERDRENTEYEAEEAKRTAERADRDRRDAEKKLASARAGHEEEAGYMREEIDGLQDSLAEEREKVKVLLAACEEVMEFLSNGTPVYPGSIVQASVFNAIAKAKGE